MAHVGSDSYMYVLFGYGCVAATVDLASVFIGNQ